MKEGLLIMKAYARVILITSLAILLISGLALAQSGTYESPPLPPSDESPSSPSSPSTTPPVRPEEPVYNIGSADQLDLKIGDTIILNAFPEPIGVNVVWDSGNKNVATVAAFSPTARVTALAPGTTVITCIAQSPRADGSYWRERVTINVTAAPAVRATPSTAGSSALPLVFVALILLATAALLGINRPVKYAQLYRKR
jgi:hypothetical protein